MIFDDFYSVDFTGIKEQKKKQEKNNYSYTEIVFLCVYMLPWATRGCGTMNDNHSQDLFLNSQPGQ